MYFKFSPKELVALMEPETAEAFRKELHSALLSTMSDKEMVREIEKKVERSVENTVNALFTVTTRYNGEKVISGEAAKALNKSLAEALSGMEVNKYIQYAIRDEMEHQLPKLVQAHLESPEFLSQFKDIIYDWKGNDVETMIAKEVKKNFARMYQAIPAETEDN